MKKIAFVASTVGYHWEEVVGAYREFRDAGYACRFFTVDGKAPQPDPTSIVVNEVTALLGFGISAAIAPDSELGRDVLAQFAGVAPVAELVPADFDAIYLPGGHGCLFDLNTHAGLHAKISELYRLGKALAGVCHATSTFAFVEVEGRPITEGKALTGFPEPLDRLLERIHKIPAQFLPIPFSNDGKLIASGARLGLGARMLALANPTYTREDFPFFTGVGPKAAGGTARNVIRHFGAR